MLDGGAHTLALHSFDVADGNTRRKKGIFAEVFKIAAIHRSTIDVPPRPEQKMNALSSRIPADFCADPLGKPRIPGCCKGYSSSHGCGRPVVADSQRSVRHLEAGHAEPGDTAHVKTVDPSEQVNFFFDRHVAENRVDPTLGLVRRRCSGLRKSANGKKNNNCVFDPDFSLTQHEPTKDGLLAAPLCSNTLERFALPGKISEVRRKLSFSLHARLPDNRLSLPPQDCEYTSQYIHCYPARRDHSRWGPEC